KRLESYEIPDKVIFSIDIDFLRDPQKAEKVMFDVAQMRKSQKVEIVFFDTKGDEVFQEFVRKKYRVREDDILVVTGENTGKQLIDQIRRHSLDVLTNEKEQIRVIGFEENWKLYGDYLLTQKIPAVYGDRDFDFEQLLLTVLYSGDEDQLRALMRDQLHLTSEAINELLPKDGKMRPLYQVTSFGRNLEASARAAGIIEKNM
ncbi:MAG: hypothetical protein HYS08_06250, partial [Chlamydiae bacterium]|nr:hypothetical protein [Chlamydiota bacterium]